MRKSTINKLNIHSDDIFSHSRFAPRHSPRRVVVATGPPHLGGEAIRPTETVQMHPRVKLVIDSCYGCPNAGIYEDNVLVLILRSGDKNV
jgi:hypothetical protein